MECSFYTVDVKQLTCRLVFFSSRYVMIHVVPGDSTCLPGCEEQLSVSVCVFSISCFAWYCLPKTKERKCPHKHLLKLSKQTITSLCQVCWMFISFFRFHPVMSPDPVLCFHRLLFFVDSSRSCSTSDFLKMSHTLDI